MYLSIKNEVLFNEKLSDQAIATMLIMSGLRNDFDTTVIVPEQIISILYGKLSETERKDRAVKESIQELIKEEIITPIESKKNMSRFLTSDLSVGTEGNFTLISIDEFEKLRDNLKLLRFYLVVVSTINNKSKVGFTTNQELADKSFIDISTVSTYNKTLIEREVLFIYNEHQFVNGQQSANTYGRYEDKDLIIKNAKEYYGERNFASGRTMTGDERRRISKQYNDYCKGSFKGDVEQLKADCKRYNDLTQTNHKDLSVFECNKNMSFDREEAERLFSGTVSNEEDYELFQYEEPIDYGIDEELLYQDLEEQDDEVSTFVNTEKEDTSEKLSSMQITFIKEDLKGYLVGYSACWTQEQVDEEVEFQFYLNKPQTMNDIARITKFLEHRVRNTPPKQQTNTDIEEDVLASLFD